MVTRSASFIVLVLVLRPRPRLFILRACLRGSEHKEIRLRGRGRGTRTIGQEAVSHNCRTPDIVPQTPTIGLSAASMGREFVIQVLRSHCGHLAHALAERQRGNGLTH